MHWHKYPGSMNTMNIGIYEIHLIGKPIEDQVNKNNINEVK